MSSTLNVDICVIGGGSGGLGVAAGAVQMGAKTVLIESGEMGGDCLNYGCVPSKALIAAGKHAKAMTDGADFGITPVKPQVDFAKVNAHVKDVIASIAPMDSVERFEGLGVTVLQGAGRFVDKRTVEVNGQRIKARRIVVATGSSAATPPIPGLEDVSYLTNENIFDLTTCPEHLIIIGGGPIGMEMAQAHLRLGARVTVLEAFKLLGKDDPELTAIVLDRLRSEGADLREGAKIARIDQTGDEVSITLETDAGDEVIKGSHLLVAAGRKPNLDGLNLEAAGIDYTPRGIKVDDRLRTSNKKVFAIGDVAGGLQFTHVAGYHAGIVIRNALFRVPAKADHSSVPWVTYTDPEMAHVGLTEEMARQKMSKVEVLRWPFAENDRAAAERKTEGLIKVITDSHARILGASIVGPGAGELILPWVMAVSQGMKVSTMASVIAPYPTMSEVSKRAAGSYYTPTLFSPRTRFVVRFLSMFG